jgi:hypothetical protein
MVHVVQRYVLASAPASLLTHVAASGVVVIFLCVKSFDFVSHLWGPKFFSQFSGRPHLSESMLWICLCALSKLGEPPLLLLYLAGRGASFSLGVFLCWSSLR